jgi:charged multivesicular body protein 2A
MADFEQQNEIMGMKEEMMSDAMDEAFADDEDEDEEDAVLGTMSLDLP